jgi:hypothetical protein
MNIFLQSTAAKCVGRGYLSSDHISTATGLDPAFTISKNGGSFANPAAGPSVMTEIESTGWYYFSLGTGDTDTLGPLIIRGTHATMDNIEVALQVVSATPAVNTTLISGDSTAADNAESFFDGTGYAGTNNVIPLVTTTTTATNVTTVNGIANNAITAASIADGAIDNATFAADVGSTAYATNIIALACDKSVVNAALATATNLSDLHTDVGTAITNIGTVLTESQSHPTLAEMEASTVGIICKSLTTQAKADVNAEVDGALNTAIPGSPTADSINERIVALDTGGFPTTAQIADAVWDEVVTTGAHDTATFAGKQLLTASSAGDPWATALPGAYGAGTAGKLIGDNINAPIGTVDTVVDSIYTTVVTNAAGVDIAADIIALKAETAAIIADTNELQTDWVNGGRLDSIVDGIESHVHVIDGHITADYGSTEKSAIDLIDDAAGGLADIHTDLGTLTTTVGAAGAGLTAAGGTGSQLTSLATATNLATVDTVVDAIKLETDKLTITACIADSSSVTANSIADGLRYCKWFSTNEWQVDTNPTPDTMTIFKGDNTTVGISFQVFTSSTITYRNPV